jgi:hypothetical protein
MSALPAMYPVVRQGPIDVPAPTAFEPIGLAAAMPAV